MFHICQRACIAGRATAHLLRILYTADLVLSKAIALDPEQVRFFRPVGQQSSQKIT